MKKFPLGIDKELALKKLLKDAKEAPGMKVTRVFPMRREVATFPRVDKVIELLELLLED